MAIPFAEKALQIGQYNPDGLLNYLKEYYTDPDVSQRALECLRWIRQGDNEPFAAFFSRFERELMESDGMAWPDYFKNLVFGKGLKRENNRLPYYYESGSPELPRFYKGNLQSNTKVRTKIAGVNVIRSHNNNIPKPSHPRKLHFLHNHGSYKLPKKNGRLLERNILPILAGEYFLIGKVGKNTSGFLRSWVFPLTVSKALSAVTDNNIKANQITVPAGLKSFTKGMFGRLSVLRKQTHSFRPMLSVTN